MRLSNLSKSMLWVWSPVILLAVNFLLIKLTIVDLLVTIILSILTGITMVLITIMVRQYRLVPKNFFVVVLMTSFWHVLFWSYSLLKYLMFIS